MPLLRGFPDPGGHRRAQCAGTRGADPEAAGPDAMWARNLALYYDPPDIHPTPDLLSVP
ncbi:hypothetical protein PV963_30985 [Streptomyces coeruleorubidus]|uniref:hypothetical protein n=1 Tax=Streptomyces coeruleorubidus TaxID=116188 RepID=UPI00237F2C63|nr:hypothetical protein [Streptomyces coeruleorubidus]WDV54472.1 hypothetical protein PV963_30985 [Streptomyces coeruleorubidus]